VFRPLQQRSSQALLIATIGLAITLGEALRLLTGSRQRWLQPFFTEPFTAGAIVVNPGQIGLAGLALTAIVAVIVGLHRTAFGRAYRACADDPGAAALVGVDIASVTRWTCVGGGMLAAIAGFVVATHYGIVSFAMGTLWGLKALTAAVVGGIGSVPGAALGGVLIGLVESLWAGYLPSDYKEVAVFAVLATMLALRPNGLFGQTAAADNPMLWRSRSER
jgi:branched-chain amino acid transport system permease protein